ncbi:hypothetical protein Tco_0483810 [Tanacetum coccineum]
MLLVPVLLLNLTAALRTQITNDIRNGFGSSGGGGVESGDGYNPQGFMFGSKLLAEMPRGNLDIFKWVLKEVGFGPEIRNRDGNRIPEQGTWATENKVVRTRVSYDIGASGPSVEHRGRQDRGSEFETTGFWVRIQSFAGVKDCPKEANAKSMPADFARLPPTTGRVYATTRDQAAKTSVVPGELLPIHNCSTLMVILGSGLAPIVWQPVELKSKGVVTKMLEKWAFIRPSVSPWGGTERLDVMLCVRGSGAIGRDDNVEDGKHTEFSVDDDSVVWFEDRLCVPNDQAL